MDFSNKKQSVALSSVLASFFLTVIKFIVGVATGSMGIISEAAHSLLDFGAALLTYFAVKVGDKPADSKHPYGHGKVESVSALIETGLLFVTSIWIIYEATQRFFAARVEIETTWYAFAVILVSIVVDFSRSRALSKVAKETGSQAIEADALHFSSDILSSLVVLLGLVLVSLGITKADAVAAFGVSLFVLHAGFVLGKRTLDVLVDAAPVGITEKIAATAREVDGVMEVKKIRVRPVGLTVFVDLDVAISRKLSLEKAHAVCNEIEKRVRKFIQEADITVHTIPVQLTSETIVEQVQLTARNHNLSVHDIVVHTQNGKKYLSYDLEVDAKITLEEAHKIATHLETTLQNELGREIEINTHIEPLEKEITLGQAISGGESQKINKNIGQISKTLKPVKGVHNILTRGSEGKLFISIHCLFDGKISLEDAHDVSSRFEYLIREQIPKVKRVVVHAEPLK